MKCYQLYLESRAIQTYKSKYLIERDFYETSQFADQTIARHGALSLNYGNPNLPLPPFKLKQKARRKCILCISIIFQLKFLNILINRVFFICLIKLTFLHSL